MDASQARRFAQQWVALWNARDLDAILDHYSERVAFSSPLAPRWVGTATIEGRADLRAYWRRALDGIHRLHFTLDRALWDGEARVLAVVYVAELDARRVRGCEVMWFGTDGKILRSDAHYGAELAPSSG